MSVDFQWMSQTFFDDDDDGGGNHDHNDDDDDIQTNENVNCPQWIFFFHWSAAMNFFGENNSIHDWLIINQCGITKQMLRAMDIYDDDDDDQILL